MKGIEELYKIVGDENVRDEQDLLGEYSEDMSLVQKTRPRCVVKVYNIEEIQDLVKWANVHGRPLIPVSSGPPHFHGDTVPSSGGSVIVDLTHMKKIIKADRVNRLAMIEPGVTFQELIPECEKVGLTPYLPLVPRLSKSVLTSYLEREPITTPRDQWESQDPLLCVEITYGNGELFRTGSAAGPGSIDEQWSVGRAQIRGLGPAQIDFAKLSQAAQGTMGIISWATVKCKILPKISKIFLVPSDDVERLIDLTYRLLWKRLGNSCFILNSHNLASILGMDSNSMNGLQGELPSWVLIISIDGAGKMPEERVAYQEDAFVKEVQIHGLVTATELSGIDSEKIGRILLRPSSEPYWKTRYKGNSHDLFFQTTMDKTPGFVNRMYETANKFKFPINDIGVYLQPMVQGSSCHCEFNLSYDPKNTKEVERIKVIDQEACHSLSNMGAFFSRPYGSWATVAYNRDAASMVALKKIKDIFDPNNVMNPGKLCF